MASRRCWHPVPKNITKEVAGDGDHSGRPCRLPDLRRLRAATSEGVALRCVVVLGACPGRLPEAEVPLSGPHHG